MVGGNVISLERYFMPEVYAIPQQHFWIESLGLGKPHFGAAVDIYIRNYLEQVCERVFCEVFPPSDKKKEQVSDLDPHSLEARLDVPKGLHVRYFQLDQGQASELHPTDHFPEESFVLACLYSRRRVVGSDGHLIDSPLPGLYTRHPAAFPQSDLFYSRTHPLRMVHILFEKKRWNYDGMIDAVKQYLQSMYGIRKAIISFPARPKYYKAIQEWKKQTREGAEPHTIEWVFLSVSTKALPVLLPSVEERYRRVMGEQDGGKAVYDGEHGRFTLAMSRDRMYCSITAQSDAPGIQRIRLFSSLGGMFKRSLRQARSQKKDIGQDMFTATEI